MSSLHKFFETDYINAEDFAREIGEAALEIARVEWRKSHAPGGKATNKPVLWFRDFPKCIFMARQHYQFLLRELGEDEKAWTGYVIHLHTPVKEGGGGVAIRIREDKRPYSNLAPMGPKAAASFELLCRDKKYDSPWGFLRWLQSIDAHAFKAIEEKPPEQWPRRIMALIARWKLEGAPADHPAEPRQERTAQESARAKVPTSGSSATSRAAPASPLGPVNITDDDIPF